MLKKRILASSMASVMALTSVCAVAFADDTTFDTSKAVVTKGELKAYIESKEIKELIDGKVDDYGSISGANFLKATEFAQKVIDGEYDNEDNDIDYATVAYQMVKAEKDNLKQYTAAQLEKLVNDHKAIYNTENKLNAINDLKYYETGWNNFVDAYESAEGYVKSEDIRVTTDEYEKLDAAIKGLNEMPTKRKSEIESARTAYEKALKNEYKYQPWMRGTVSGSATSFDGKEFTWGALYATIASGNAATSDQYDNFDAIKEVSVTSNTDIVAAVNQMETAAKILNGFSGSLESGSETKAGSLLKKYHGQMVWTYNKTTAEDIYEALRDTLADTKLEVYCNTVSSAAWAVADDGTTPIAGTNAWNVTGNGTKLLSAELKVRIKSGVSSVFAIVTKDKTAAGYGEIVVANDGATYFFASKAAAEGDAAFDDESMEVLEFKAGSTYVLSDYVSVDSNDVLAVEGDPVDSTDMDAAESAWNDTKDDEATAKADLESAATAASATATYNSTTRKCTNTAFGASDGGVKDAFDAALSAYNDAVDATDAAKATYDSEKADYDAEVAAAAADAMTATHAELNSVYDGVDTGMVWPGAGLTYFTDHTGATYTNSEGDEVPTAAGLALAMSLYDQYKAKSYSGIDTIDIINNVVGDPKGSGAEWKLVYNYLKYSLSDLFDGSVGALHTKKDVDNLIDKSYTLTETTVQTSLFNPSHMDLVDVRQLANDWSKAADKIKPYTDNESMADFGGTDRTADYVYNAVVKEYNELNTELSAFKYSYEEIALDMARAAKALENGKDENLAKALAKVAAALTEVEAVKVGGDGTELPDSEAFSADGTFNYHNRLFTADTSTNLKTGEDSGDGSDIIAGVDSPYGLNSTHRILKEAYNEMKAILDGELKGDATVDGNVRVDDATLVLKHVAKTVTLEGTAFKNADVDGNGTVNVADATAILKMVAENAGK